MCEFNDIIQEPVKPIIFSGFKCQIDIVPYNGKGSDGSTRKAIVLEEINTGDHIAIATINVPEEILADDEVVIKDYSENEGMLSTLISAKTISVPVRFIVKGRFPICKLLLPCKKS